MINSEKHIVVIVSGGRTGTRFLGERLSSMIEGGYSVHEPDLLDFSGRFWPSIRRFGLYHMTLGRVLGRTGIRNLSQRFLAGRMDVPQLVAALQKQRLSYFNSLEAELVIEANYQWYGALPAVPEAFPRYKVLVIVRDPRTWVRSWLNFGGHYGPGDWLKWLGVRRLDPRMMGDREFAEDWGRMSPFQKLCWDWKTIYSVLGDFVAKDEHTMVIRYEDLFLGEDSHRHFEDMLKFVTSFDDRSFEFTFDRNSLSERVHASVDGRKDQWERWDASDASYLERLCGPLMRTFGYGGEAEWATLAGVRHELAIAEQAGRPA